MQHQTILTFYVILYQIIHSVLLVCACRYCKALQSSVFGSCVTAALSLTQDSPLVVLLASYSEYQSFIGGVRKVKCYLIVIDIIC